MEAEKLRSDNLKSSEQIRTLENEVNQLRHLKGQCDLSIKQLEIEKANLQDQAKNFQIIKNELQLEKERVQQTEMKLQDVQKENKKLV